MVLSFELEMFTVQGAETWAGSVTQERPKQNKNNTTSPHFEATEVAHLPKNCLLLNLVWTPIPAVSKFKQMV